MTKGVLMLVPLLSAVAASFGATAPAADFTTTDLCCERLSSPTGINVLQPQLSWVIESSERGQKQTAYRVLVATSQTLAKKDTGDLWDSGKLMSDETVGVVYAGKPLASQQRCFWKVKVWDKDGRESAWSPTASWSMGLLEPGDWKAQWIGLDQDDEPAVPVTDLANAQWVRMPQRDPSVTVPVGTNYFRRTLGLPSVDAIKDATMCVAADSEFRLYVNGKEVGHGNDSHIAKRISLDGVVKAR